MYHTKELAKTMYAGKDYKEVYDNDGDGDKLFVPLTTSYYK